MNRRTFFQALAAAAADLPDWCKPKAALDAYTVFEPLDPKPYNPKSDGGMTVTCTPSRHSTTTIGSGGDYPDVASWESATVCDLREGGVCGFHFADDSASVDNSHFRGMSP